MWFSMEGESRLVEGRYAPIPVAGMEGGTLTARSEVLGLKLRLTPGALVGEALRFFDPVRREPLRSLREEAQAREEAERGREAAEARLREEQAARQALEAEIQELRRRGG